MAVSIPQVRRRSAPLAALLLVSLTLAACGGDDDDGTATTSGGGTTAAQTTGETGGGGGGGGATLALTAEESGGLKFSRSELTARAGNVTMTLDNPSANGLPHAVEIEGNGVEEETETIEPGARASVTVDLRPGRYEFYCPVDGHREAGMRGTLTVS